MAQKKYILYCASSFKLQRSFLIIVTLGLNSMLLFILMLSCGLRDQAIPHYNTPKIQESKDSTAKAAADLAAAAEKLESYIDEARRENTSETERKNQISLLLSDLKTKEAHLQNELSKLKANFKIELQAVEQ